MLPYFMQKKGEIQIAAPFPFEVLRYNKYNFFGVGDKYGLIVNHMQNLSIFVHWGRGGEVIL